MFSFLPKRLPLFLFLFSFGYLQAQTIFEKGAEQCALKQTRKENSQLLLEKSVNTPKHTFDVLHYALNLDLYANFLSPYPKSFAGSVTISCKAETTISTIELNASDFSLTIDSVAMAGKTFSRASNILTVTLNSLKSAGDTFTVKIFYRHNNVTDYAFYVSGGFVFTDCQPEGARSWFPCWDRPSDKATFELKAKTPSSVKLGSNGKLISTATNGDSAWFHWKSRDPISTYLIVISAKVGYNLDIVYWKKLSDPNDSVPMYFYWNSGENAANLANIKSKIIPMTTYFSELFGEHPFEKNGFATLNSQFTWGGMENQTLTSLCPNCWGENLVSHEFGHQWFGDMITCGTWADLWLNEGFATYCEALWFEKTGGYISYKNDIDGNASYYLSRNPGWSIYNPLWAKTTPGTSTLFNTAMTYMKGACVIHMLRYVLGDSVFFKAIKDYATDTISFKYKNVVTADFVTKINESTGQNLQWFFDQWVYGPNHPVYQNKYSISQIDSANWNVKFVARQTQTNAGFFTMPIEIYVAFKNGSDTTIRVFNNSNDQIFNFQFKKQPTAVGFDVRDNIVLKQSTLTNIDKYETPIPVGYELHQNYPNPFNGTTQIRFSLSKAGFTTITLYDLLGKKITQIANNEFPAGENAVSFNASSIASGAYYYSIQSGEFTATKKLVLMK